MSACDAFVRAIAPAQIGKACFHLAPAGMVILTLPIANIGILDLVKGKRRHNVPQRSLHQFALIARHIGLCAHPFAGRCAIRPHHNCRFGLGDFASDDIAIGLMRRKLCIPPHIITFILDRTREPGDSIFVFARIGQEYIDHQAPPCQ